MKIGENAPQAAVRRIELTDESKKENWGRSTGPTNWQSLLNHFGEAVEHNER